MSRLPKTKSAKKPGAYHHGNLHTALLEAARTLVDESGIEGFTLREVARRAGVSPGAPYHHFKDKAEIISALVQESLTTLDQLSREAAESKPNAPEKLRAIGVAYVTYAVTHTAEFRLMFRPELGTSLENMEPSTLPVFRVLTAVVTELGETEEESRTLTIAAWSLVHGLTTLLLDGPLRSMATDLNGVKRLAEQVTSTLDIGG